MAPEFNNIKAYYYFDLSAYYNFSVGSMEYLQLFGGISNVFDKDPPIAPINFISALGTNPSLYDVIGRQFYAGVRLKF